MPVAAAVRGLHVWCLVVGVWCVVFGVWCLELNVVFIYPVRALWCCSVWDAETFTIRVVRDADV